MVIQTQAVTTAVTAATAKGVITVGSGKAVPIYPGTLAWVYKSDGSAQARVKIIEVSGDTVTVRRFKNDDENAVPQYGRSDMSGFATGAFISLDAQLAPANPANAKL